MEISYKLRNLVEEIKHSLKVEGTYDTRAVDELIDTLSKVLFYELQKNPKKNNRRHRTPTRL